jgi:hypothetical protein
MIDKQSFVLTHTTARQLAIEAVRNAPNGYVVEVKTKTRSLEQNALLHSLLGECAKTMKYHGKTLSIEQWKVLFVSAHNIVEGRPAQVIAGIEGEFVNIRESTAKMTVKRLNSLIEYIQAWIADNNQQRG